LSLVSWLCHTSFPTCSLLLTQQVKYKCEISSGLLHYVPSLR